MEYQEKKCSRCKKIKSIKYFNKDKSGKFKVFNWCKDCVREYDKKYYNEIYKHKRIKEFKPKIKICGFCGKEFLTEYLKSGHNRKYCKSCSIEAEHQRGRNRYWNIVKPQKLKIEFEPKICPICKKEFIPQKSSRQIYCVVANNDSDCFRKSVNEKRKIKAEKLNKQNREFRKNNPDKAREYDKRKSEKRKSDPKLHLNNIISVAIRRSLKNGKDGRHWISFVDYSAQDLIKHLESQFKDGMSWSNQGFLGWHIDHIKPIDSFNFESYDDPEFKECWSLNNLQPLWWQDNMKKGNRII